MATTSGATLDDLLSTTLQRYAAAEFRDNIFTSNALFYFLRDKARGLDGGAYIEEPVMYQASTAGGSYQQYDTFNVAQSQGLALAEFNWKQYYWSITLSGFDDLRNQGTAAVIDLLEARTNQARMSLFNKMNVDLFADGTGNASKELDGLAIAIDSAGTYGGLSRTTSTWWSGQETAVSGALSIARMRTMFNSCSKSGAKEEQPQLLMTTQSVYEFYENLLQPDQRFTNTKLADGGFLALEFKGAGLVYDESCTSGTMFFINPKYLNLKYHSRRNFATRPFMTPANQDARVSQILWMGNLTGSNCRRQGKLTGVTS